MSWKVIVVEIWMVEVYGGWYWGVCVCVFRCSISRCMVIYLRVCGEWNGESDERCYGSICWVWVNLGGGEWNCYRFV